MDKNIHAGRPNEKANQKFHHLSSVVTQAWCVSQGIPLVSYEREFMRNRKPNFILEKYSCISEKGWLCTHMLHKKNPQPFWTCSPQEQTSVFAFGNDQTVPAGILVGKMCTSRAETWWLLTHGKCNEKSVRMGGLNIFKHSYEI